MSSQRPHPALRWSFFEPRFSLPTAESRTLSALCAACSHAPIAIGACEQAAQRAESVLDSAVGSENLGSKKLHLSAGWGRCEDMERLSRCVLVEEAISENSRYQLVTRIKLVQSPVGGR